MNTFKTPAQTKQRGAATLIVVMILLFGMTIISLTASRSGLMEQKITGNDIRAREAQEAAEAGLEYGVSWAGKNIIGTNITCPGAAGCPGLQTITGSSSGETYSISSLVFTLSPPYVKVTATAQATDTSITATSESYVSQVSNNLFNTNASSPPPWIMAGCLQSAPSNNVYLLGATDTVVTDGTSINASCLPLTSLIVSTWADSNNSNSFDAGEQGANTSAYNKVTFTGSAWDFLFQMTLADAKTQATNANHVYAGAIPCGATSSPAIYVINNAGPIDSADMTGSCSGTGLDNNTIGAPGKPILLIIPSASGCPSFAGGVGGITIYGIVYYESTTACATVGNGWGGAKIHGSVMWEGSVNTINANSNFVEINYGSSGWILDNAFQMGVFNANRLSGTWNDFN
jgi:Tfp pilus assembly protein PilX